MMPTADVNGTKMNYETAGNGIPVILITGFGGDISYWNTLVPMLSDKYKVITLDNRGAGRTKYEKKFTLEDIADDIVALMDHLSIYKAHIVGWSMGGCMAQEIALKHPARVISLTLISAFMRRPSRSSHIMNALITAAEEGMDIGSLSTVMQGLSFPESVFRKREDRGGAIGKKQPYTASLEGIRDQMAALDKYDSTKRISGISVPTLCIQGLDDFLVPPEICTEIHNSIKGSRIFHVHGAGHVVSHAAYVKIMTEHFTEYE